MKPMLNAFLAVILGAALVPPLPSSARSETLVGQATVIDGDTIEIHGTRIRLFGIDAPEGSQLCRSDDSDLYRCGAKSANALADYIARRPVSCEPVGRDVYGRTVATCSVAQVDLGDWLVRGGLALDWPKYSKAKYEAAQHEAEQAKRGIWAGSYIAPWLYRRCIKDGGKPNECSDDANAR
jgi:endonuclease YncB( thermonuclease family)